MGKAFRLLGLALGLSLVLVTLPGQDLSCFLSKPPGPGSWAKYRVTTRKGGKTTVKPLQLEILASQRAGSATFLTLEVGPTKFAGYKDGILQILVKDRPAPEEALNPFLQTLSVAYQPPGSEPFKLSESALDTLHDQARKVKVAQRSEDLPPEEVASIRGGTFQCSKRRITTTTVTKFFLKEYRTEEVGVYWISDKTPFRIVQADLDILEVKGGEERRKQVTVQLKEGAVSGAATRFTAPAVKEKGVWGLLFH